MFSARATRPNDKTGTSPNYFGSLFRNTVTSFSFDFGFCVSRLILRKGRWRIQ
jgi:hypothetical protein